MKQLILAAALAAMASTASAGIYSGIEYNSNVVTADAGSLGFNDVEIMTSGFETYIGFDKKVSNTLTFDIKAGYVTGDMTLHSSLGQASLDNAGYNITAGFENKFDDFTIYGKYNYNMAKSGGYDIPSYGITTGIRLDF